MVVFLEWRGPSFPSPPLKLASALCGFCHHLPLGMAGVPEEGETQAQTWHICVCTRGPWGPGLGARGNSVPTENRDSAPTPGRKPTLLGWILEFLEILPQMASACGVDSSPGLAAGCPRPPPPRLAREGSLLDLSSAGLLTALHYTQNPGCPPALGWYPLLPSLKE